MKNKQEEPIINSEKLADLSDALNALLEVANGERAKALGQGYANETADQIGGMVYARLLDSAFSSTPDAIMKARKSSPDSVITRALSLSICLPFIAFEAGLAWRVFRATVGWGW